MDNGGQGGNNTAPLSQKAFPSLGGASGSGGGGGTDSHGGNIGRRVGVTTGGIERGGEGEGITTDAGAVWGGTGNSRRKRGPGQGRGRRPATPPRLGLTTLPENGEGDGDGADASTSSEAGAGLVGVRNPAVVDVMEVARDRQRRIAQSSLPKIGGSGYGFAWERKKAQQKRKEIRGSVKGGPSSRGGGGTGAGPGGVL